MKAALNPPAGTMAARSLEGFLDRVEECNRMEEVCMSMMICMLDLFQSYIVPNAAVHPDHRPPSMNKDLVDN